VIQQGDHQVLSGKPPYSLFLGNAPGVTVSYHGKPVDLGQYTRAKDNTARLSVPEGN
jgi:cytoskeleton protein RodZ